MNIYTKSQKCTIILTVFKRSPPMYIYYSIILTLIDCKLEPSDRRGANVTFITEVFYFCH